MIIIIIIFAKGINHSRVRAGDQARGREDSRGGGGGGSGPVVNTRLLLAKTHPCPSAPLHCMCHRSPSICPSSTSASIKHRQSGQVPAAQRNKRKRDSVALIDDESSPELGADKRPAKYELTAANLTGNRLSGVFVRASVIKP